MCRFNLKYLSYILLLCVVGALCSCGGKKDDPLPGPTPVDGTSDRTYLEDAATRFMSYFKPVNQQTAITSLSCFVYLCETYTFPPQFSDEDVAAFVKSAKDFNQALADNDYIGISRTAPLFVYNMARFQGLFQANSDTKEWQMIEPREHIAFRYWVDNNEYNIIAKGEGGVWSDTFTTDKGQYMFEVPKNLVVVLQKGQTNPYTDVATIAVKSDGKDSQYLNIATSVMFANIVVDASVNCTNTTFKEKMETCVDNVSTLVRTPVLSSTADFTGNNICSAEAWENFARSTDQASAFASIFSKGTASVDVMLMVRIKSEIADFKPVYDFCSYLLDNTSPTFTQNKAEEVAAGMKAAIGANMYYAGESNKVRGTLGWEAYLLDDAPGNKDWGVRPTLTLESDGATYSFNAFFGNGRFLSVERQYTSLMNTYKNYWNSAKK